MHGVRVDDERPHARQERRDTMCQISVAGRRRWRRANGLVRARRRGSELSFAARQRGSIGGERPRPHHPIGVRVSGGGARDRAHARVAGLGGDWSAQRLKRRGEYLDALHVGSGADR